jgi:hypothetical protein
VRPRFGAAAGAGAAAFARRASSGVGRAPRIRARVQYPRAAVGLAAMRSTTAAPRRSGVAARAAGAASASAPPAAIATTSTMRRLPKRGRNPAMQGMLPAHRPRVPLTAMSHDSGDERPAMPFRYHLELTPAQLKITHTALRSLLDDFGHDEPEVLEVIHEVLAKLPDEHAIRAIALDRDLERQLATPPAPPGGDSGDDSPPAA